jgi:hypothetical protein
MGFGNDVPGAVVVPGFNASPRSEEAHSDNESIEPRSTSTVRVNARVVDETEERRILREELHQVLDERDHVLHEYPAPLHAADVRYANAVVAPRVTPIHPYYEESGIRHGVGRKRLAIGAILAIVVVAALATGLTLWLKDPTPSPTVQPTPLPTVQSTPLPTVQPTPLPTVQPTSLLTVQPISLPTVQPTPLPTVQPTASTSAPIPPTTTPPTPLPTPSPNDDDEVK